MARYNSYYGNMPYRSQAGANGIEPNMRRRRLSADIQAAQDPTANLNGREERAAYPNLPPAMAWIGAQQWKVYDANTALEKGTLFPDLYLPFTAYKGAEE